MPTVTLARHRRETALALPTLQDKEAARRQLNVRGLTITTAIAWAVHEQLATLEVGEEIELATEPFPAIVPDLEAWCRMTGHELVDVRRNGESWQVRLRKGALRGNEHGLALVVSTDDLTSIRTGSPSTASSSAST